MSDNVAELPIVSSDEANEKSVADLFALLEGSPRGLSGADAEKRLAQYGYNEISEKHAHPLLKFLGYFWGPIAWMIEVAAVLSAIVRHWADLTIITILLVFNGVIGFWEEYQAGNAIEQLRKNLALTARVLRDGTWHDLEARCLVPGDVIRLRLGDVVPADIKLFEGDYLSVDQSALTGESLPVDKKPGDLAYSGSIAKQGEMEGVVTATGMNTFFGRTARLVSTAQNVSHFQRAVLTIGDINRGRTRSPRALADGRAVRADPHGGVDSGRNARSAVDHDGDWRDGVIENEGDRRSAGVDRGNGRDGRPVFGQDRYPYSKQTYAG
jgi:H+-transporting ATPase